MNRVMRAMTVAGMAGLLLGCATQAQRQYQAIATGNQAIGAQAKACEAEVYNAPEAASLRPHFPMDLREATLTQLSDPSLATKPEIDAILLLYPRLQACQKAILEGLVNTMPGLVPILAKGYSEGDDDTILLIQRKLTWGDRIHRGRNRVIALQAAMLAEAQRVVAALEQSHEAELARRQAAVQAAAAALASYAQTQQVISNMNRPVNCTTMNIRPGFQTTSCY
jgi:hypothetical protein